MATWSGWIIEFLQRANILNTPPNQTFMSEWAAHDGPGCKNAPVTLSTKLPGSTRCGATVTPLGRTQDYPSHASAAQAFTIQMNLASMKPIKDALNSGNPFQIGDRSKVVAALKHWGSPQFAAWYATATTSGGTGGGGPGKGSSSHAHHGWADLRHTLNHNLPKALRTSGRNTSAALRSLGRGRKVKF